MTIISVLSFCIHLINSHIRLTLAILVCLICARQGSSTVVPIGSCILIYSESCPRSEIQFHLFTRNNPNNSELVYFSDVYDNVTSSSFNSSLPNKIIVHGYNADMNLDILQNIKTAYLQKGDYNVWFANWPDLCRGPCYVISVYNLDQVGKCLAQMITRLKKYMGDTKPDLHLIGFSLGAHVAAYTARHLKPYKLPRITGLDPAMPMFANRDRNSRLDVEDAKFVDVIHTSAFVQGQYARSGHVDFYMNGGIEQPGCWNASNMFDCNHRRAPQYFAESINSDDGFWGWPCTGILNYILDMCPMKPPTKLMGENCAQGSRGFYIVPTKSGSPFAKGPLKMPSSKSKASSSSSNENSITTGSRDKSPKTVKADTSSRTGKKNKLNAETSTSPATSSSPVTSSSTIESSSSPATSSSPVTSSSTIEVTSTSTSTPSVSSTTEEIADSSNEFSETTDEDIPDDLEDSTTVANEDTDDELNLDDLIADNPVDSEITDSRFVSKGTEIEFSEDVPVSSTSTSSTTTEKSGYRFIYKVPRPKKDGENGT